MESDHLARSLVLVHPVGENLSEQIERKSAVCYPVKVHGFAPGNIVYGVEAGGKEIESLLVRLAPRYAARVRTERPSGVVAAILENGKGFVAKRVRAIHIVNPRFTLKPGQTVNFSFTDSTPCERGSNG